MNKLKAFIPNLLTLGNLLCGCLAIYFLNASSGTYEFLGSQYLLLAFTLVFISLVLDFFDGFVARLLKVDGEIGKQLDSLADMVSFGVVPGFIMFKLFSAIFFFPFIAFLVPLLAAYRLAKFNIDTEQSVNFKGLATPAYTLFVIGIASLKSFSYADVFLNRVGLAGVPRRYYSFEEIESLQHSIAPPTIYSSLILLLALLIAFLMVSNIPMFSLKAKNFSWKDNWFRYILLIVSVVLLIWLKLAAFAIIIPFYIILSLIARKSFVPKAVE